MSFFQKTDWSVNYRVFTFQHIFDLHEKERLQIEYAKNHEWLNSDIEIDEVLDTFSKSFHRNIVMGYQEANGKIILCLDTDHHVMLSFIQGMYSFKGVKFNDLEHYSKNRILKVIEIEVALYSPNSIMDQDFNKRFTL